MSGDILAAHIQYKKMVKARSEAADQRAERDEKNAAFRDDEEDK